MYDVVKVVIESKRYELKEMLVKIDTLWVQGSITNEQRTELIALAQENAKMENSINILNKLEELDKRVRVLEDRFDSDSEDAEGETEGDTEEVVTYPEYQVGKWYYRGDKITFDGKNYVCIAPEGAVCTWNPVEYPPYWEVTE